MTSRERVLRAIAFEPADVIPLWQTGFFEQFMKNWQAAFPNYRRTPDEQYGYDTEICIGNEGFFPTPARVLEVKGDYTTALDIWGRTLRTKKGGYFEDVLRHPLEEKSDLDKLEFESPLLESRWDGFGERMNRVKSSGKCGFAKIGGLYIRSHFIRDEAELLMDMLDDEPFCNELFDRVAAHFTAMALETLRRGDLWETGLFVFDDMASTHSPMFSPACFEKYFLPRYKRLIDTVRAAGCRHFFLHSDGDIRPLFDMLLEAGFEGFHPLEPRSGMDLVALREKYGDRMVLFGGVCNTQILPRGDREEIRRHVEPLAVLAREGGVVLGMSSLAEDSSPQAYDYYMSLLGR